MAHHRELARPQKWDLTELPSLTGKTAIVTGANSPDSLGWHIAYNLALKGAKVFVGARNLEKANAGIAAMIARPPYTLWKDNLKPLVMDLGDFKQVQRVAKEFLEREERLDILVNNAGLLARQLDKDENGISVSFGTNHLAPFLLTTTLLPLLVRTSKMNPDVRIVNVSSTTIFDVPSDAKYGSLEDFNQSFGSEDDAQSNYIRYGYSKLANVIFTAELQRHLSAQNTSILAMSLHPGGVATNGAANYLGGKDNDLFRSAFTPFEGAITPLYAAAHPEPRKEVERYRGAFLLPWGGVKEVKGLATDEQVAKQLWETSEKVLGDVLQDKQ